MAFLSNLVSLVTQPTVQAIGAGLLSGVVGGTALVASGVVPVGGDSDAPATIELLACPDTGPALARVSEGGQLLLTGRNEDGTWYEVYIGQPGVDRAWAPASALSIASGSESLPIADCAAPTDPVPTLGPPPTATPEPPPTPTAPPSASLPPSASPSVTATVVAPTPTASPTKTPAPTPTKKPSATPTKPPTAPPTLPPPTPSPTPFVDTTAPTLSGLTTTGYYDSNLGVYLIYGQSAPCTPKSATITVTATDNVAVASVQLSYWPGNSGIINVPMTHQGGNTWTATITAQDSWSAGTFQDQGLISYWARATDTSGIQSTTLNHSNQFRLYKGECFT